MPRGHALDLECHDGASLRSLATSLTARSLLLIVARVLTLEGILVFHSSR
jgi:hypothetical protein